MLTLADIDNMFPQTRDGSIYSDLHKDAYGFRPRGELAMFKDIADFDEAWKRAADALEREQRYEEEQKQEAIKNFEEEVASNMEYGAATREDAIRWICQARGLHDEDQSALEYAFGLPYGYLNDY